jgi:hypothetical protein
VSAARFVAHCGGPVLKLKRKPKGQRWKDYLTRPDLVRRFGISSATIARMDARGELPPSITWGGARLYHIKDIEQFEHERFQPKLPKR